MAEKVMIELPKIQKIIMVNGKIIRKKDVGSYRIVCNRALTHEEVEKINNSSRNRRCPEDIWKVQERRGRRWVDIGKFYILFSKDAYNAVSGATINKPGTGIGTAVYRTLADYYGYLESDPDGCTSCEARGAWEALGARKLSMADIVLGLKISLNEYLYTLSSS